MTCLGEEAKKLFDDAQRMLSDIVNDSLLHCAGVFGFWRASSVEDDIEIYDNNGRVVANLYGLRQQVRIFLCLLIAVFLCFCSATVVNIRVVITTGLMWFIVITN